jgi:hypothetical protein
VGCMSTPAGAAATAAATGTAFGRFAPANDLRQRKTCNCLKPSLSLQADFSRSEGILGSRCGSSNLGCPAARPFAQEQQQGPIAPAASSLPAPPSGIWRQRYQERAGKRLLAHMLETMGIALLLTKGDACLGRQGASFLLDPPQPCCRDRGGLAGGAVHLPAVEGAPRLHPMCSAAGHLPGHLQRLLHAARLQHQARRLCWQMHRPLLAFRTAMLCAVNGRIN